MDEQQVKARLAADGIDYMLAQFVDINGTPRCKGVPASAIDQFLAGSAGFAGGSIYGMGQGPHEHDMIARPDLDTYTPLGWEEGVVRFACDIYVDDQPWTYCSRSTLKRALARLADAGYEMKTGVEAEHILVTRNEDGTIEPFNPSGLDTMEKPCYDFKGLSGSMAYLRTLLRFMEQLGWEPYASDHEDGTAQFELNWNYTDSLTTADRYTFFKMMTSQVAQQFGAIATHMPKPFARLTGNGSHIHFSLWDRQGNNVFVDPSDPRGLGQSKLAYNFLGGLMAHGRALTAVIAPTVNDYKRLSAGAFLTGSQSGFTWTPAFITYGDNNRTHMFRTPDPGRFECRTISGAVNLYLGLAAMIAAGLDGIERNLDPGDPIVGKNMYAVPLSEMRSLGLTPLPQSLTEALDAFEQDEVIQAGLGEPLAAEFLKVKRQEWVQYHATVSQWEVDRYLTLF